MKRRAPGGSGLALQYALQLTVIFILLELVVAAAVLAFLIVPMAQRAAADLAGLMVLSAQTWGELPPETRPAFELELARTHQLALRAEPPVARLDEWHMPYFQFLEEDLAEKTGQMNHLVHEMIGGEDWYWVSLPAGEGAMSVGFPLERMKARPLFTLVISLALGIVLAISAAAWLARRAVKPLGRFEQAVADVGQGKIPDALPETGPREIAGLARALNEMARQVRESLATRTTLLAGVSHDLRTPLARMRLALAMLPPDVPEKLSARMHHDVEEMNQLIGEFLDLARGLQQEEWQTIEVCTVVGEVVDGARAGGATVNWTSPAPCLKVGAPLALRRILENLVQNAIRYGAPEPVTVECECSGQYNVIRILDRGPGIAPDQRQAVFRPFYRIESSRSDATGGSGLGLAIAMQLADAHGWRIELDGRPGGGTEARLIL
jgi:two-component system osmolarity sensor histidine kinase EnvZ